MIPHSLRLEYQLSPGWLTPWSDGILRGEAVARRCAKCNRVSFAPLRCCNCGAVEGSWITLSGEAEILNLTDGADGCFGLVRFDGAQTKCVAQLSGFTAQAKRGRLIRPQGQLPAIILAPVSDGTT